MPALPRPVLRPATRRVAALVLGAAALVAGPALRSDAKVARPKITNVWARTSPAMATAGAAYLNITSRVDDRLVGASVARSVAVVAEIHETVAMPATTAAGMGTSSAGSGMTSMPAVTSMTSMPAMTAMPAMTMRPVAFVALPAGKKVELKPGGYHVMLMGLAKPLQTGTSFTLTLRFQKAGSVSFKVPVKPSA